MKRTIALLLFATGLSAQTPQPGIPCPASSPLLKSPPVFGVGTKTIQNACPAFVLGAQVWFASIASRLDAERWNASQIMTALTTGQLPASPPPVVVPPVVTPPPTPTPAPSPTVPSGGSILYADDFSSYKSTQDFQNRFWVGTNRSWAASPQNNAITYDTLERALRYDWPSRTTAACTSEITTGLMPRVYPPPTGTKDVWVTFRSMESPGFETGKFGCARAYKFFLIQIESLKGQGRVGLYFGPASNTLPGPTRIVMDMVGRMPGDSAIGPDAYPLPGGNVSWGGSYHTWTLGLENIGGALSSFSVYLDGVLIKKQTTRFMSGQTMGPGWAITFEMGANINNGPDHPQSRWFKQILVATQKPSNLP